MIRMFEYMRHKDVLWVWDIINILLILDVLFILPYVLSIMLFFIFLSCFFIYLNYHRWLLKKLIEEDNFVNDNFNV